MVDIRRFQNGKWSEPDVFNISILKDSGNGRYWDRVLDAKRFNPRSSEWISNEVSLSNKANYSFSPLWKRNYNGSGRYVPGLFAGSLAQGRIGDTNVGLCSGLMGFDVEEIQARLQGKIITGAKLMVRCSHSRLARGADISLVSHRHPFAPDTFDYEDNLMTLRTGRGKITTIDLGIDVARQIASGDISGLGVMAKEDDARYYGAWDGFELEIKYIEKYQYSPSEPSTESPSKPIRYTLPSTVTGIYFNPTRVVSSPKYTTVRSGDGFWTIAKRLMDSGEIDVADEFEGMQLLLNLNGFTSTAQVIHPGQLLRYK